MNKVVSLTHHGMGELDDGRLVPRVLLGETVEITDSGPRILVPSADRVAAPCRHFKSCGGCSMQHASDGLVSEWKTEIVRRALAARGLPFPFKALHVSPAQSRRRAKFGVRRTKQGAIVGFHGRASHTLLDVPDCQLLRPSLLAERPALAELARLAAPRKAEIAMTVTESGAGVDVHIAADGELTETLRIGLSEIASRHGLARLTWGDEVIVTLSPPEQQFGSARVVPPPAAFLQATQEGEDALIRAVQKALGETPRRVVDLFSGCGTFSLPLASRMNVHCVEGDRALIAALDSAWRKTDNLHHVTTETRDLFRRPLEPDELNRFDAAVIDPPRAGAAAQCATLAASKIGCIAMVSCNPISFARDVETLIRAGFLLDWLEIVDQFRWSAHVEVVARLTRS